MLSAIKKFLKNKLSTFFYLIFKFFIFILIFAWVFSGWPPIWKNPRIPPEIKEAQAQNLFIKSGYFTKSTTTGNQSVTGLGFQPKAILFYWVRASANSASVPRSQGIGFTDCTNQRAVAVAEDDNAGTSNAGRYRSESNVIVILSNGNPTLSARASFVSCDADGFTINWVVNEVRSDAIYFYALGGSDITNVRAGTFTLTTTLGNQSVTGLGFQPNFLMFLWSFTEAVDTASTGLEIGMGVTDGTNQGAIVNVVQDGQANNATKFSQQRTDNVILLTTLGGAQDALANIVSLDADGFTVNKSDAPAANTPIFYLAIKGGVHKVGNFLQPTTTGNQTITGVGSQPNGLLLFSFNRTSATTLAAPAYFSLGTANASTSQGNIFSGSRNIDPSQTQNFNSNSTIITMRSITGIGGAGTNNAVASLSSFNPDGFTLNWSAADATQRQIIYWAIAPNPSFNQSAYRFFNNLDSTDVGLPLALQDTPATLLTTGATFRLRLLLHIGTSKLALNGQSFKLQFAQRGTDNLCDTAFTGETYVDVTTSTVIAFNDNPTPTDGAPLTANINDPTHGTDTIVNQTYEELNNFTNSVSAISPGQDGKWDFSLKDNGAPANTTYCFRVVKADGSLLNTYTVIPQITTAAAPSISCSVSATSTSFSALDPSNVYQSSPDIIITVTSSAGFQITVQDTGNNTNPGLYKSTSPTYLIPSPNSSFSATATLAAGTDGYGIQATTTNPNITINSRYNQTGNTVGGLTLTATVLATSSISLSSASITVIHKASVSPLAPTGNYSDTITYSCSAI